MDSLKRSMRWDETAFGREYDLDVFNIVAVSDFNMGAMENKGLNVFNDKYVLADPDTATDADYGHIEGVIAHEYFHNWTGDRITCRDWFQLCLKEGLTVFRDQEFSSDMRSRAGQAHRRRAHPAGAPVPRGRRPARPSGAAGDLSRDQQLLHADRLREGRRGRAHAEDGARARTASAPAWTSISSAMTARRSPSRTFSPPSPMPPAPTSPSSSSGIRQAGTPEVDRQGQLRPAPEDLHADARAVLPADARPGQQAAAAHSGPLRPGRRQRRRPRLRACRRRARRRRRDPAHRSRARPSSSTASRRRPVPSLLRGFSAPVRLNIDLAEADLLFLLRTDADPFNRWQAAQTLAMRSLIAGAADAARGEIVDFDVDAHRRARRCRRERGAGGRLPRPGAPASGRGRHRPRDRPRRRSRRHRRGAQPGPRAHRRPGRRPARRACRPARQRGAVLARRRPRPAAGRSPTPRSTSWSPTATGRRSTRVTTRFAKPTT